MLLSFEANQKIIEQGKASGYFYMLRLGNARVVKDGKIIGHIHENEVFGEMALFNGGIHGADVISETPCIVDGFRKEELKSKFIHNPKMVWTLLENLVKRIEALNERLVSDSDDKFSEAKKEETKKPEAKKGLLLYAADERTVNATGLKKPILIDRFPFKIGRKTDHSMSLTNLQIKEQRPYCVSRNHLTLALQDDEYILSDLESRKGTKVNNLMIGFNYPNSYATLGDQENLIEIGASTERKGRYSFVAEIVYAN